MPLTAEERTKLQSLMQAPATESGGDFDLSTAQPVEEDGAFDLSTAQPVDAPSASMPPPSNSPWPAMADWQRSGGDYLSSMGQALAHPIQTAQGIGQIGMGVAQKALPGVQPQEMYADAVGEFVKQRYGSWDRVQDTFKHDPVGFLGDLSVVVSGGAGAVGKVGQVGKLSGLAKTGQVAGKAGALLDPLTATLKTASLVGKYGMTRNMEAMASRGLNSLIDVNKKSLLFGRNPGLALAKEGIIATSHEDLAIKAQQSLDKVGQQIGAALVLPQVAAKRLNNTKALQPLHDAITHAQQNPRSNAAIITRLENLRDDFLGIVVDEQGNRTITKSLDNMSPQDTFNFKKQVGELTRWTVNREIDTPVNAAMKDVYKIVRQNLEGAVPGIHGLNNHWADLLEATIAAKSKVAGDMKRRPFGFMDTLAGVAGGTSHGVEGAIAGVLVSKGMQAVMQSPMLRTSLSTFLANATPAQAEAFLNKVPGLRSEAMRMGMLAGTAQQRVMNAPPTDRQIQ